MAFTKGRWEAYTQHTDYTEYVVSPITISGTTGFTKVAAGDYAVTVGTGVTAVLAYKLPSPLRTGEPHLEDTLLTTQATTGPAYDNYNHPKSPYTIPGPGAGQTLPVLKGAKLKSIDVIYSVATDALTALTVGIFAKYDTNGSAPTVITLLSQALNGLSLAVTANRNVINVPIATANQAFIITPDTVITAELDIEVASGGSADIFGVCFNFDFNPN